jgi:hypothetical protein
MNIEMKRQVIHQFAAQLQDNHGQRLTEALIQGLVIKLELLLPGQAPDALPAEPAVPSAPDPRPAGQAAPMFPAPNVKAD